MSIRCYTFLAVVYVNVSEEKFYDKINLNVSHGVSHN